MKTFYRLAMGTAVSIYALNAAAQKPAMEHVLVSVPIHKKEAETALPVTVLTGKQLQRQAATSLGETLGNKPGIANSSFGPGVGRPVIRGQQGQRAISLQNGTLSADVSGLSPDHAVTVEPLLADSIEILRGPSTLLYGGGAIGGVVNTIDNRIPRTPLDGVNGTLEYRYDDASDMDSGVFRIEAGNGQLMMHLSGTTRETDDLDIPGYAIDEHALEQQEELLGGHEEEHEEHEEEGVENTDGYIANTDTDTDVLTGGFSFHFNDSGFVGFAVSHIDSKYGIPPGSHTHHEEEHEEEHEDEHEEEHEEEYEHEEHGDEFVRIEMEETRYDTMLHLHNPANWIEVVRGFVTYTDYEHKELEGSEVDTEFERDTWETRLELVHNAMFGVHGVVGLQWRADEFSTIGEEAYVPKTDSNEIGLFLLEDFHSGDWTYELGLRADYVERDPDAQNAKEEDFTNFSMSTSALWDFTDNWQAGLSLSRAARAPSTEELYSNIDAVDEHDLVPHAAVGVIEVGDADLDEEVSLNADLSLRWAGDVSWVEVSVFYNQFEDYIFLFNSGEEVDETPVYLYQQDDAKFYGVEFESSFYLFDLGPGALAFNVHGDMISGEFDDAGDVPRLPPARVGAELNWSDDAFGVWVRVLNAADQDDPGEFETETEGYTRWDLGADYRWQLAGDNELLVFGKWKNIGDEEIRLSTSFLRNYAPQAGESFEVGMRYIF